MDKEYKHVAYSADTEPSRRSYGLGLYTTDYGV